MFEVLREARCISVRQDCGNATLSWDVGPGVGLGVGAGTEGWRGQLAMGSGSRREGYGGTAADGRERCRQWSEQRYLHTESLAVCSCAEGLGMRGDQQVQGAIGHGMLPSHSTYGKYWGP